MIDLCSFKYTRHLSYKCFPNVWKIPTFFSGLAREAIYREKKGRNRKREKKKDRKKGVKRGGGWE